MITPKTQAAIAVLNDIYAGESALRPLGCALSEEELYLLLSDLTLGGLLSLSDMENPHHFASYRLTRTPAEISLLEILEATGENLDCIHPTTEAFHSLYGRASQKLGVINHMTRVYLDEIKLSDL